MSYASQTNTSLLKDLSSSQSQAIVELALHKLATLSRDGLSEYEHAQPNEIQTQIAVFLVDQINHQEAQFFSRRAAAFDPHQLQNHLTSINQDSILDDSARLPSQCALQSREDYLDWSLRIDLRKNKERTVQTGPIFMDGQSWAFLLDLGNGESAQPAVVNAYKEKGYQSFFGMRHQEEVDESTWFKLSVLLCSQHRQRQPLHSTQQTEQLELSNDQSQKQLQSKRCKFIRKKSVPGTQSYGALSPTARTLKGKSKSKSKSSTATHQMFNSTFGHPPDSVKDLQMHPHSDETAEVKPQIFKFELCAEVRPDGSDQLEWVTLQQETITSLKAPRGYPNLLFQLPKYLIAPVIHADGRLNLKIKFE